MIGPVTSDGRTHQAHEAFDQVVHITEGTGLGAVSVEGDRLPAKRLHDEIGDDTAVVRVHARPVRVEDPSHADIDAILTMIIEEQRLGASLSFIVAGPRTDGVHAPPIALGLRLNQGIAIDLAGRRLEDFGLGPLRQPEHVDGAVNIGLDGLHRVELVVNRRGRAGKVVDLIHLDIEGEGDVVPEKFEARIVEKMQDRIARTGEVVVHAKDVIAVIEESLAEEGPQKSGASGNQDTFASNH